MEVPCCGGMTVVLKEAIKRSGKEIPLTETIVGVRGDDSLRPHRQAAE
jgi:hypothetical protein